jgi:hypothetical protein
VARDRLLAIGIELRQMEVQMRIYQPKIACHGGIVPWNKRS